MSEERDELADGLQQYALAEDRGGEKTWADYAEAILAAGYRKPRVKHEDYAMEAIDKVLEQYYRTQLSPMDALNQIAAINGAYKMGERS